MTAGVAPAIATTEARDPTCCEWIAAIRSGDFERAWTITDRDVAATALGDKHVGPRHRQRIWRGEPLEGQRILVRCYHGLGDTIQFARFLPVLGHRARQLTVWCQPPLLTLIESLDGVDAVIPLTEGAPETEFDVDIEIMETAHAVRATRDMIEIRAPYLTLPPRQISRMMPTREMTVGLVWEVGDWDKRRSIPCALLNRLNIGGIRLCSLQREASAATCDRFGAINVSTDRIDALGHRMSELDLIVCVDTMTAHLAGALGLEAWIMLHFDCDWRWPSSGDRSLWYSTLRLFHQRRPDDWSGMIDDIRLALFQRLNERQRAPQEVRDHAPGHVATSKFGPADSHEPPVSS